MQFSNEPQKREARDTRGRTTGWIWMWSMIMMGPSIPMVVVTRSPIIPLAILCGAAASSACVWIFGGSGARRDQADKLALEQATAEAARLRQQVEAMEERLFALETMTSYERAAAQRDASRDASQAPQATRDPLLPSTPRAPLKPWKTQRPGVTEN